MNAPRPRTAEDAADSAAEFQVMPLASPTDIPELLACQQRRHYAASSNTFDDTMALN